MSRFHIFFGSHQSDAATPITVDQWAPNVSHPSRRLSRTPHLAPCSSFEPEPQVGAATIVAQAASAVVVVFAKTVIYSALAWCPFTPTPSETVTLDKWAPEISQPAREKVTSQQFGAHHIGPVGQPFVPLDRWGPSAPDRIDRARSRLHLYPTFATDGAALTQPERSTPDKWLGYRPDFARGLKRTPHLYPTFATDYSALTQSEQLSADKWLGYRPDFARGLKRTPHLYPTFATDDAALTQPERSTPDKWLGYRPDFARQAKRLAYLYPSFAFEPSPQIAATSIIASSHNAPSVVFAKTIIYQSRFEPPYIAPAAPLGAQDWLPTFPDRIHAPRRAVSLRAPSFFQPLFTVPVPIVSLDGADITFTSHFQYQSRFEPPRSLIGDPTQGDWRPTYPDRIPQAKRPLNAPSLFAPERQPEPPLEWRTAISQPTYRAKTNVRLPGTVAPERQPEPPLEWRTAISQPTYRAKTNVRLPGTVAPERQPEPPLEWRTAQQGQPNRSRRVTQTDIPLVYPIAAPAEDVTLDKWLSPSAHRIAQTNKRPEGLSAFLYPIVAAEDVTLDKWNASPPQARRSMPFRPQSETIAPIKQPEPRYDWRLPQSEPIRKRPVTASTLIEPTSFPEILTLDKWAPTYPERIRRSPRALILTEQISDPIPRVPFGWHTETQRPPKRVTPRSHPFGILVPIEYELEITLDKWSPTYIDRYRRVPRCVEFIGSIIDPLPQLGATRSPILARAKNRTFVFEAKRRAFTAKAKTREWGFQSKLRSFLIRVKNRL